MKQITIEQLAAICHNANREYQKTLGEEGATWNKSSDAVKSGTIRGVAFMLANPLVDAASLHENWVKDKVKQGYVFGETKSETQKTHPQLVPYASLPEEQRIKDRLFAAIIAVFKHAVAPFDTDEL